MKNNTYQLFPANSPWPVAEAIDNMRAVYQEEKRKRIARNHRSFELNSLRRQQTRLKTEALKIAINIDSIEQLIVAAYRRQNVFVPQNLRLNCTKLIEGFSLQQHSINDAKSCIINLKKAIQTLQNGLEKRHVIFMNIIKKRQSGTSDLPRQKVSPQSQPHHTQHQHQHQHQHHSNNAHSARRKHNQTSRRSPQFKSRYKQQKHKSQYKPNSTQNKSHKATRNRQHWYPTRNRDAMQITNNNSKSSFRPNGAFNPVMTTPPRKKKYADSESRLNPDSPVFTPRRTHSSQRLRSP